ncbi:MAG: hypothetical protein JSW40_03475 [Candidatus Omnitrophota bacterium]|nr:MAG: hypothetical protein JSW40_03475 [Candidatus Omnitrophota bacterium]
MKLRFKQGIIIVVTLALLSVLWGLRIEVGSHGTDSRGFGMIKDIHVSYGVFGYHVSGTEGGQPIPPQINYMKLAITIAVSALLLVWCKFMLARCRNSRKDRTV